MKKFIVSALFVLASVIALQDEAKASEAEQVVQSSETDKNSKLAEVFGKLKQIAEANDEEGSESATEDILSDYLKWYESFQETPFITVAEFKEMIGKEIQESDKDAVLTKGHVIELIAEYQIPGEDPELYFYGLDLSGTNDEFHLLYLEGVIQGVICPLYIEDDAVTYYEARLIAYVLQTLRSAD